MTQKERLYIPSSTLIPNSSDEFSKCQFKDDLFTSLDVILNSVKSLCATFLNTVPVFFSEDQDQSDT